MRVKIKIYGEWYHDGFKNTSPIILHYIIGKKYESKLFWFKAKRVDIKLNGCSVGEYIPILNSDNEYNDFELLKTDMLKMRTKYSFFFSTFKLFHVAILSFILGSNISTIITKLGEIICR